MRGVVVWHRGDYLAEGYKQLNDSKTYSKVNSFGETELSGLVEKSNDFFLKGKVRSIFIFWYFILYNMKILST